MPQAIMPGAIWRPVRNFSPNRRSFPPQGLVLHIAQSHSAEGTIGWMNNPDSQVSSHFVNDKDGTLYQCVSALDRAWCQVAGNAHWWSVENIGYAGDKLTDAQLATCARIFGWLHKQYGIPLQSTDDPTNGFGLGWHGMGGASWGGHTSCPGAPIVAQRPTIVAAAQWISAL